MAKRTRKSSALPVRQDAAVYVSELPGKRGQGR